jgi:hypothetical protein
VLKNSLNNSRIRILNPLILNKTQKMVEQQYNPYDAIINDVTVKLRDIEEKQNIIKDQVILIGENLVSEREDSDKTIFEIKKEMQKMNEDIKRIKMAIERIVDDSNNFIRKNEFEILQRQFQMFQPLELARISDVEDMINRALKIKNN